MHSEVVYLRRQFIGGFAGPEGSLVPNALAAPFALEKANRLSLLGIEKLMGELQGIGTRRTMAKPISLLDLLSVVHTPILQCRR